MQLWIFDLDGTLTDSFPVFFRSMKEIFSDHGRAIREEDLHTALGSTMPEFFTHHLGAPHVPAAIEKLRRLSVDSAVDVRPFPGIAGCLETLRARGREIAVWTARDRESTDRLLHATGLGHFAGQVVTGNCVSKAKPDPEGARLVLSRTGRQPTEAVIVGDHHHDVNAARAAGVFGVRASWNPYWKREPCTVAERQFFSVPDFAAWLSAEVR